MSLRDYLHSNSKDENKKIDVIFNLYQHMKNWKCGTVINGILYNEAELTSDQLQKYHTLSLYEIKRYRMGNCWDFVNLQHSIFVENDIPDESYLFLVDLGDSIHYISHTFSIIIIDTKKYWFECAWKDECGIHLIHSYQDVINKLSDYYDRRNRRSWYVYQYDPTGLDHYLTEKNFLERVTSNKPVIQHIIA